MYLESKIKQSSLNQSYLEIKQIVLKMTCKIMCISYLRQITNNVNGQRSIDRNLLLSLTTLRITRVRFEYIWTDSKHLMTLKQWNVVIVLPYAQNLLYHLDFSRIVNVTWYYFLIQIRYYPSFFYNTLSTKDWEI